MWATMRLRARCARRGRHDRHRRRRWDMAWTAPSFGWLVANGMVVAAIAGGIAGALVAALVSPLFVIFGGPYGGTLGFLGSWFVAPVVALVLQAAHGRSIRIALRRARIAAVLTTFLVFQVLLPVVAQGRPAGVHEVYALGVAVACVAAWWSVRALVVAAVRKTLRESAA